MYLVLPSTNFYRTINMKKVYGDEKILAKTNKFYRHA